MSPKQDTNKLTLGQRQRLFVKLKAELVLWIYQQGYELSDGEAWRTPEMAVIYSRNGKGTFKSAHCNRLAQDWNLFKDGTWLTKTEDWKFIADKWKSMHPLCRAGYDFTKPDGNHVSLEYDGIA